jgi:hypothetical protein
MHLRRRMYDLLDWTTPNPTIDQGSAILRLLRQDNTFAVRTVIFSSDMVWCINRSQKPCELKVRMHREEVSSQILWTLAVLQKSGHELFGRRSRPSLAFFIVLSIIISSRITSICRFLFLLALSRFSPIRSAMIRSAKFIVKYNNLIHMINSGCPSNLTNHESSKLSRLTVRKNTSWYCDTNGREPRSISTGYRFHHSPKAMSRNDGLVGALGIPMISELCLRSICCIGPLP